MHYLLQLQRMDAARSLSEDRDKSAAASAKDAKDRISELEEKA